MTIPPEKPEKAADSASKIKNIYSLAALALLLIHSSVNFAHGLKDETKAWLLSGMMVASVIIVFLLRKDTSQEKGPTDDEYAGLHDLIESTVYPMYLTDRKMIVLDCNDRLSNLLNSGKESIIGHSVADLLKLFIERVPKDRQSAFKTLQQDMIEEAKAGKYPNAEVDEYIDNRNLKGGEYIGMFRIWIHADKLRRGGKGEETGSLVFYRVIRVNKIPPVSAPPAPEQDT